MNKSIRFILLTVLMPALLSAQAKKPAEYVNPFIGASTSTGKAGIYHG